MGCRTSDSLGNGGVSPNLAATARGKGVRLFTGHEDWARIHRPGVVVPFGPEGRGAECRYLNLSSANSVQAAVGPVGVLGGGGGSSI